MKNMDREIFRCNHLKHLYGQAIIVDSNNKYIERINMKTIEQGLNEAYEACGNNAYFGNGFREGVKFADQWIPVNKLSSYGIEDLPLYILVKDRSNIPRIQLIDNVGCVAGIRDAFHYFRYIEHK